MAFKQLPVIALIPARAGSKGIPNKNIQPLNGKPLLQYSIEAALDCRYIDRTVVSSDSNEICKLAKHLNAETVNRPKALATDDANINDSILHVIENLGLSTGFIILLQPTSPLRTVQHIEQAFSQLAESSSDNLVSVFELVHTPFKSYLLDEKYLKPLMGEQYVNQNRQSLPKVYQPNGAIYIFSVTGFLSGRKIPQKNLVPYLMSSESSIDIDSIEDLEKVNTIIEKRAISYARA